MFLLLECAAYVLALAHGAAARCRSQPGSSTFPSTRDWAALNQSIDGRLITVVPSAKACAEVACTPAQWSSATFRNTIPGQMNVYNWEQNYTAPELCLYNQSDSCSQGDVPYYAINATSPQHIQAGAAFASQHDLRVSVKSSGHDYLGRSTARNSLLLWTHYFQAIELTDSFSVGGKSQGSAVTVGSGVGLRDIYAAAKAAGKMFIGGTAATVSAGGGYTQGAGHSGFSPIYGLAADNVLQYQIVLANGSFVTANEDSNADLFWALRGGGAGSWGVITSVTAKTYPAFSATFHIANFLLNSSQAAAAAMTVHARHIFDYDGVRAGQYFYVYGAGAGQYLLQLNTLFSDVSGADATAAVAPFLDDARAVGAVLLNQTTLTADAADIVRMDDDEAGFNTILGSRLIPAAQYKSNPVAIGAAYKTLLDQGVSSILGHLVAGGKVAENANVSSAVHPKWRTAKTHVIATTAWSDSAAPSDVLAIQQRFVSQTVPVLAAATGESDSGAYSNEGNVQEPDFQTTFFGANYARLLAVKAAYDPENLFIVGAGVGSERWDAAGMCNL